MKIMRWRKKKHISRQGWRILSRPIVLAIVIIIVSFVSIVSSKTAQASKYDDWLNDELNKYGASEAAKGCAKHIKATNGFINPKRLRDNDPLEWGKLLYQYHTTTGTFIINYPGVEEGMIEKRSNKRFNCIDQMNDTAKILTGDSNYFCNYLKKDAQKYIDAGLIKGDNVKAHIDNCDLSSLAITWPLYVDAYESMPDYNPSDAVKYYTYQGAVEKYCVKDGSNPFTEAESGNKMRAIPGDDGNWVVKHGYYNLTDSKRNIWVNFGDGNDNKMTCEEAAQKASELADAYAKAVNEYLEKHPEEKENQKKEEGERLENQKGDECASELHGFGSIICSGQNLFANIVDILYGIIANILLSQTEITKSDVVRQHWGNFLSIANIILIIAFLVVIYSTATSTGGLSNYDVKKLLPRIIIFAIAINLSFYICMALVDLSTILGKGMFGLLMGGSAGDAPQLVKHAQDTAAVLAIKELALVAVAAVLVVLVGAPIIMALLTIVFALIVRGIALMILVIVSPIAIALYLFNSQGLSKGFTMWLNNYIKLLLVFPLFMLVWGGSRVVSSLTDQSEANKFFVLLIETICLITPALSIMPLFKMSGDIMGKATIMAASNGAANKFAGWTGSKLTGKPGDPKHPGLKGMAAGAIGGAAGNIAGRAAGAVQNMRGVGASTGNIATQLDSQAMNSARNKVNKYGDRDLKTAFTTGQIGGKTLDPYQMRAVIEKELPNASAAEIKQSMQAVNTEADKLRRNGQAADADRLVQTFANTASANGNSIMSGKSLRNFATSGGWNTSQFEANYADAVADYSSTQLTAKDAAGMDAADLIQMRTTLQNAGVNGGNIAQADAGLSSMAKQSNIALSDPKLTRKMNAPTVTALKDNTMVRSTAGERLANTHKIPNIYHDYNAGGTTSAQAISDARTMMAHTDFGRLDAIDQSRLRAIARASAPTGTGAPAAPVVIASWDSRVP